MSWIIVVVPAVVSGVLGSIITTYGTQARERRDARAKVRTCLLEVERLAFRPGSISGHREHLVSALDDAEVAMLAASVPHYLIAFYRLARMSAYSADVARLGSEPFTDEAPWVVAARVAGLTAALAVRVIWHPWLSAVTRRWRVRRLKQILAVSLPDLAEAEFRPRLSLRKWERELRRAQQK